MEKKTIGQFIAALRKANGMTQKDLAEQLNVSDKAVSRWERDECAPDISLIPLIADIFGVTADELLRGERKPINTDSTAEDEALNAKSRKKLEYLLKKTLTNYKLECLISALAVPLAGLIIALILNAFNSAWMGLGIGIIIYIIASVLLTAFTVHTFSKLSANELGLDIINKYKKSAVYTTWLAASAIFVLLCFTMPLAVVYDAYTGLNIFSLLTLGSICAAIGMIICAVARFLLTGALIKRGMVVKNTAFKNNRKLLKKTALICAAAIAIVGVGQIVFNSVASSSVPFAEGNTFDTFDKFKDYMEKYGTTSEYKMTSDGLFYAETNDAIYEIEQETITDDDGNILCRYTPLNKDVVRIDYNSENCLPITTYTSKQLYKNNIIVNCINIAFVFAYIIVLIATIISYRRKREKC